jgi:hypothetical protein
MRFPKRLLSSASTVLLCACHKETTGLDLGCFFMCWEPSPPVALAVTPDSSRILLGDTITYYAWSCPAGGYDCGLAGNAVSDWSILDSSAVAVLPDGPSATVSRATSIVVRGASAGDARIMATDGQPAHAVMVRVAVVDSSAVTVVDMRSAYLESEPVHIGTTRDVPARLRSATGALIRGRATAWTISDTTIATLSTVEGRIGPEVRVLHPKKPGTVDVSARFLDVVGVLRLTIQ